MAVSDAGATSYSALLFDGANSYARGDNVVLMDHGFPGNEAVAGAVAAANTWNHACSVDASNTSHIAYLNGVAGTTNTFSQAPASYNHIDVGALRSTTTTFSPLDGRIAEVAFWSKALTAAEVLMLSKGVSPLMVRPNDLNRYWPLIRGGANEIDRILREVLVQNGTMGQVEHVRQFYPVGPLIGIPSSGLAAITGTLAATIDPVTLSGTGQLLIQGALAQTIPDFTLSASADLLIQAQLAQTIADFTLSAQGLTVPVTGTFANTIADFTLNAGADLLIQGSLGQTFANITLTATGDLDIQGQMSGVIDTFTLSASADLILNGAMAGAIDAFSLTAAGTLLINGTLGVTIGAVTLAATGLGPGAAINGALDSLIDPFTLAAIGDNPDFPAPGGPGVASYIPTFRPRRGR